MDPTPNQIRGAYGLGSYTGGVLSNGISFAGIAGDGRGQTIAIVDAYDYPTAVNDANVFSNNYGLPTFGGAGHPTLTRLNQTGGTSLPGTDPSGPYYRTYYSDREEEEALDIEWAHAIAPMANIILFEATNDSNNCANLFIAAQTAAKTSGVVAVSMSWGMDESGPYGFTAAQVANYDSTVFGRGTGSVRPGDCRRDRCLAWPCGQPRQRRSGSSGCRARQHNCSFGGQSRRWVATGCKPVQGGAWQQRHGYRGPRAST